MYITYEYNKDTQKWLLMFTNYKQASYHELEGNISTATVANLVNWLNENLESQSETSS